MTYYSVLIGGCVVLTGLTYREARGERDRLVKQGLRATIQAHKA